MSSELHALLAAVVADPSDDVARLVYADCLEERGQAARAQFIRLQIEAERHHPHSKMRAELEQQARALFEQNWVEWWAEVCAAVGLPAPLPRPSSRLGRLAGSVGLRPAAGIPYRVTGSWVSRTFSPPHNEALRGFARVLFRGGFPDTVEVDEPAALLPKWAAVSPLRKLILSAPFVYDWTGAPHLANVAALNLADYDPEVLPAILRTQPWAKLTDLNIDCPTYTDAPAFVPTLDAELAWLVAAPLARQLRRLSLPLWSDRAAELVAGAESLAGLESLEVSFMEYMAEEHDAADRRLATLARSAHLAGLKELTVLSELSGEGIASAVRNPTWAGLRKLSLQTFNVLVEPLADADGLPELEDLTLSTRFDALTAAMFVRSPLLKRLRHLCLALYPFDKPLLQLLVEAVDATRLETFQLVLPANPQVGPEVVAPLRAAFGDRLRVYPS
jgi:uncharacterized protein (TIGR02996 family)